MSAREWWAGEGGNAYLQRNRVDWRDRIPFWKRIIELTGARSVYEFGCNAGFNLTAIRKVDQDIMCYGHDVNDLAIKQAQKAGFFNARKSDTAARWVYTQSAYPHPPLRLWDDDCYDLAFSAGVLIHVPPTDLEAFMQEVIRVSAHYVLAVEYDAPEETEIEYRGERGLLWKRPFGKLYEAMGLKLVQEGDAGVGFDNCRYWLMEKP